MPLLSVDKKPFSYGSLTISNKSGTWQVDQGLSKKWKKGLVLNFERVRKAEFLAMATYLRSLFDYSLSSEAKVRVRDQFFTNNLLEGHRKKLVSMIEKSMRDKYKFQMPANHDQGYQIHWTDSQISSKDPTAHTARLELFMEWQTVGYIKGAARTVGDLKEKVIEFDYHKVVAASAKQDEAGDAGSDHSTLPDLSGATGSEDSIDSQSCRSVEAVPPSAATANHPPGDNSSLAPTATSGAPSN